MKHPIILIAITTCFYACSGSKPADQPASPAAPVQYATAPVLDIGLSTSIRLPAQLAAFQEVSIFPKVNGYVQQVLVDIGSKVHKGQLLMILEDPELQQASIQAKEKYARAQSDYSVSREHYRRLLEAAGTKGAISPMDLSTAKARMQSDSAFSNAEKASWQMQETMLAYLRVTAPFDGVITERNVHPGALVNSAGKETQPMLELKQVNRLRLQADVPENIAANLQPNSPVDFYLSAFPGKKMTAIIRRKSNNVNTAYRMERVEADVWNKESILSPGMYANISFSSPGNRQAFTVPRSAVVISTERKYVILVRDHHTLKQDVLTGNTTADQVEIFGDFKKGDRVIVQANDEIPEGIAI